MTNPIVWAIPIFLTFILLELFFAWKWERNVYTTQDAVTSLSLGIMSQLLGSLSKLATIGIYAVMVEKFGAFTYDLSNPLLWIFALLAYDFCHYWVHRSQHEVHILWAGHVVHHSSEAFNLSTALRQSSSTVFFNWIFYLPMAVMGVPLKVFIIVGLIDLLYQFWVHTTLVPKIKWMEKILITPSNHRVHHGQNDYCLDKNYGAIFIFWDKIFGTYAEERDAEPIVYGVRKQLASWNPVWGNLATYFDIAKAVSVTKGFGNKLMKIFAEPGWGEPNQQFYPEKFKPHVTPTSRPLLIYALLSLAIYNALFVHFLIVQKELTIDIRALYVAVMVFSLMCLGMIWENKKWVIGLEAIRALLVFGCISLKIWFAPLPAFAIPMAIAALVISLGLLYLLFSQKPHEVTLDAH